nr:MAG TPA: hypothetical protein [Microviridae sp.]
MRLLRLVTMVKLVLRLLIQMRLHVSVKIFSTILFLFKVFGNISSNRLII